LPVQGLNNNNCTFLFGVDTGLRTELSGAKVESHNHIVLTYFRNVFCAILSNLSALKFIIIIIIIISSSSSSSSTDGCTALCWALVAFQFFVQYTIDRTPWTGNQPFSRPPLLTQRTTQNKRTQISKPRVGFEPTAPVFEREKTLCTLDKAATVISKVYLLPIKILVDKRMGIW
jgi:hypothetical protein